ncbi:hypothetical protein [Geodermatophilus sp. SYSU D00710]
MTPEDFSTGSSVGAAVYGRVRALLPDCEVRVSRSLEVHDPAEVDDEVAAWLREAAAQADAPGVPR